MNDKRRKRLEKIANTLRDMRLLMLAVAEDEKIALERLPSGMRNMESAVRSMAAICELKEAVHHCGATINNICGAVERK